MKTFRKVCLVAVFLASEALLTGCKFGWFCGSEKYRTYKDVPIVVPPQSRVYVQPLPVEPARPINPPAPKQNMLTPWQGDGPALAPTPLEPVEAPKPVQPNTPSSVKEREIKRATYKDEVVA